MFNCKVLLSVLLLSIFFTACSDDELQTPPDTMEISCDFSDTEQEVINELNNQYAHSFNHFKPDLGFTDIESLLEYLSQAEFVGLGEATHGTHEFYAMKDKIFRGLVNLHEFKAIIFEIPWGNALVINDYVRNGIGDLREVVDQSYYWVYDTQEVRELVEWMRIYNQSRNEADKLYFVGCDVQGGDFEIERKIVRDYLVLVDPVNADSISALYNLLPDYSLFDYPIQGIDEHVQNQTNCNVVYNYLENNLSSFSSQSGMYEYQLALMAAHVIRERESVYRTGNFGSKRDLLMAEYSQWWQRIMGEGSKVAIWAHNGHVNDGDFHNIDFLGTKMKEDQGDNYLCLGFSFGKGSLNAFLANADYSFRSSVQEQRITEIPCGTVNKVLSEVEGSQHYIIFEELGQTSFDYFLNEQEFMQIGAGFNPVFMQNYLIPRPLSRYFDVLVHFDETHASIF